MNPINKIIQIINHRIIYRTKWWDDFWGGSTKLWNINEFNIQVVNLGSNSGLYSFNYDGIPIKGLNWALGPQSLLHDFNLLKNYYSYIGYKGIVFIPLCPFSGRFSEYGRDKRLKYYPILHPATIEEFDDNERTRAFKIKTNPLKEIPLMCIKLTLKEALSLLKKKIKKTASFCDFKSDAYRWVTLWMEQFKLVTLDAQLTDEEMLQQNSRAETLKLMIEFCTERDLRPYIVIPPVHSELSKLFSNKFMEQNIYSLIRKATDKKEIILDYFYDTRFQKDEYFMNAYLMNEQGAKYFSNTLLKDLKII